MLRRPRLLSTLCYVYIHTLRLSVVFLYLRSQVKGRTLQQKRRDKSREIPRKLTEVKECACSCLVLLVMWFYVCNIIIANLAHIVSTQVYWMYCT